MNPTFWKSLRVFSSPLSIAAIYFASIVLWTHDLIPEHIATLIALGPSLLTVFLAWPSTRGIAGSF